MKHSLTVIILIAAIIFLPACTREKLFDRSELSMRLGELNECYSFSYENILIEENVSRIFYSLVSADDALLSITTDENDRLTAIELTILCEGTTEALLAQYEDFCAVLTSVYLSETEENSHRLCSEAGLLSRDSYFTDFQGSSTSGRYDLKLWSCPLSMSFIITYNGNTL